MSFLRESSLVRPPVMWLRSRGRRPERSAHRLITVMYHSMEPTESRRFAAQLNYMSSLGDFVTADQAVTLLEACEPLKARYFCLTFDDGLVSARRYALPILSELGIPSLFFLVPSWISSDPPDIIQGERKFLTWEECRQMSRSGVTIGSHSFSHRRLSILDKYQVIDEMVRSKFLIEKEIGQSCDHFACPWGQPYTDYQPEREPVLAQASGYRSFFTTIRSATADVSQWAIPRIRLEPSWGLSQLRYLFTRERD